MISICVLTYNGEKFVKQQLLSILQQLKDEDEVIISDDCSSDSTISIIKSLNDKRIRIFHHERIACGYKGTMKTCYLVGKNAEIRGVKRNAINRVVRKNSNSLDK